MYDNAINGRSLVRQRSQSILERASSCMCELPKERTIVGTRKDAEITARSMINAWLKETIRLSSRELPKPRLF